LTHTYFLSGDPDNKKLPKPSLPLALLSTSAFLKQKGIQHEVYDSTFQSYQELCGFLSRGRFSRVVVYVDRTTRETTVKLIRYIREQPELKEMYVILCGSDACDHGEFYIEAGGDIFLTGEAEETLAELINTLNTPMNPFLDKVDGIAFRNYFGKVVFNRARESSIDADTLPFAGRDAAPVQKYLEAWRSRYGKKGLNICAEQGTNGSKRKRSPARVCAEAEELVRQFRPDVLWFDDSNFAADPLWLNSFAEAMQQGSPGIPYECTIQPSAPDASVIADLKRSGCVRAWIATEAAPNTERVSPGQLRGLLRQMRDAGLRSGIFVTLGNEAETEKDIVDLAEYISEAQPGDLTVTAAYAVGSADGRYAGSPFSREYYNNALRFIKNEVKYRTLPAWQQWLNPMAWLYRLRSLAAQDGMQRYKK